MSVINLTIYVNGALTDPTSIELEDSADIFGVREVTSGDIITVFGTAMTKDSTGKYSHTWTTITTDNHEYEFEVVYNGVTYNRNFVDNFTAAGSDSVNKTLILPNTTSFYSSQAEVFNILGADAVELMSDDMSPGDRHLIWNHLLRSVTSTIDLYLHMFYTQTVLFSSGWIRDKATVLALNYLSERRGNPELYTNRVLKVYEELEMIRAGRLTLPGIAERGQGGPMIRNYELETFRRYHPLRIESTVTMQGDSYPGQDISWETPYWY